MDCAVHELGSVDSCEKYLRTGLLVNVPGTYTFVLQWAGRILSYSAYFYAGAELALPLQNLNKTGTYSMEIIAPGGAAYKPYTLLGEKLKADLYTFTLSRWRKI